jgi:hypothetical protein
MELNIFKTLWGFTGGYPHAIKQTIDAGMQGIEGPAPDKQQERMALRQLLSDHNLKYIAEITTAGSYVPERRATLQQHMDSFKSKLADVIGVTVSFETHRGRSLFNPWVTQRVVEQIPDILLTCDFSHWCVVCERLIDSEMDIIRQIANNAHHIHARVGYDQGPQVPNPAAPEYQPALQAHQNWWEMIWSAQQQRGYQVTTMTPEFGPDGYLHEAPFTREPVADLWELNTWMAEAERAHFSRFRGCRKRNFSAL